MTECPSCQTVHKEQPKFCKNCGHEFDFDPKANTVLRKKLTPAQAGCGCLSVIAAFVVLAVFGHRSTTLQTDNGSPNSNAGGRSHLTTVPKTTVHVGEMAIIGGEKPWICGSSIVAHDQ